MPRRLERDGGGLVSSPAPAITSRSACPSAASAALTLAPGPSEQRLPARSNCLCENRNSIGKLNSKVETASCFTKTKCLYSSFFQHFDFVFTDFFRMPNNLPSISRRRNRPPRTGLHIHSGINSDAGCRWIRSSLSKKISICLFSIFI